MNTNNLLLISLVVVLAFFLGMASRVEASNTTLTTGTNTIKALQITDSRDFYIDGTDSNVVLGLDYSAAPSAASKTSIVGKVILYVKANAVATASSYDYSITITTDSLSATLSPVPSLSAVRYYLTLVRDASTTTDAAETVDVTLKIDLSTTTNKVVLGLALTVTALILIILFTVLIVSVVVVWRCRKKRRLSHRKQEMENDYQ